MKISKPGEVLVASLISLSSSNSFLQFHQLVILSSRGRQNIFPRTYATSYVRLSTHANHVMPTLGTAGRYARASSTVQPSQVYDYLPAISILNVYSVKSNHGEFSESQAPSFFPSRNPPRPSTNRSHHLSLSLSLSLFLTHLCCVCQSRVSARSSTSTSRRISIRSWCPGARRREMMISYRCG